MNLAERAFKLLFPQKEETRAIRLKYSGHFKSYNANVKYSSNFIEFHLSKNWRGVSSEIQIGVIQHLFLKMFNIKRESLYIDLYESFIKNVSKYAKITKTDPLLKASFERVNTQYFYGMLSESNLIWGQKAFTKLGTYDYGTDTITISSIFKKDLQLLDYIMYHEMLHKKQKFITKDGRNYHHTKEFKKKEKEFEDKGIEKKLNWFLAKQKIKRAFRGF